MATDDPQEQQYLRDLIVALSRFGEQTSDANLLQEVVDLSSAFEPFDATTATIANAKAVASLWLGSVSGDSQIVERACRELQALLKDPKLDDQARSQTIQNTSILLLENARHNRSERVFRELVDVLTRPNSHLRKSQVTIGTAKLELAQLTGDRKTLGEAIEHFNSALSSSALSAKDRSQILHSLGQTHFLTGKLSKEPQSFKDAVGSLTDAVELLGETTLDDARLARLKADLGAYTLALAWTIGDGALAKEAADHYQAARVMIGLEKAPYLYARVSLGLFELHYRMKHWEHATNVGFEILDAFERIQSNPRLTSGINDFGPRALSGFGDKLAACLILSDRPSEAAFQLDKLRGRRIALSKLRRQSTGDEDPELIKLRTKLDLAIKDGDDRECRIAWEDYLTKRRELRFDLVDRELREFFEAPANTDDGTFVHLTFSIFGSHALIRPLSQSEWITIPLPKSALPTINSLLTSSDDSLSWQAAYGALLENPDTQGEPFECWNRVVERARAEIGHHVLGPIHQGLIANGIKPGGRLIMSVPGEFAKLPFASAKLDEDLTMDGAWAFSIAPSLATLGSVPDNYQRGFACVSPNLKRDTNLPDLPFAGHESKALARTNPQARIIDGSSATPTAVLEAFKSQQIVHLACHSRYGGHNDTGIFLADGEFLSLRRMVAVGHQQLQTSLVVLSACEAGLVGLTSDRDEYVGLPGTLLELGVTGVVAPLWPVHDDAALVFSDHFYRCLFGPTGATAMSPVQALSGAKQFLRDATWKTLTEDHYLEASMYSSSAPRLRRIDKTLTPAESGAPSSLEEKPFAHPHHWSGWTLWGR
ncbi:CHAT domain-containing protein [Phaeobacter porticola]|uniref:CHAT domain protein n=1 Tax=Phaeobacter porticola TaxID=1844006 RepID=A0A1L3I710_9RHOB|nr:CHAT domain-containing protein [Phaeobacter porticola]APG47890.1 CHAT domain protein [Phaeobacter porticola]